MWYVFPQIAGLGSSATARKYALSSQAEAIEYWNHAVLGPRLLECTRIVVSLDGRTAEQIFGHPDYLKFRSCMTLFQRATDENIFQEALEKYYGGEPDSLTVAILQD